MLAAGRSPMPRAVIWRGRRHRSVPRRDVSAQGVLRGSPVLIPRVLGGSGANHPNRFTTHGQIMAIIVSATMSRAWDRQKGGVGRMNQASAVSPCLRPSRGCRMHAALAAGNGGHCSDRVWGSPSPFRRTSHPGRHPFPVLSKPRPAANSVPATETACSRTAAIIIRLTGNAELQNCYQRHSTHTLKAKLQLTPGNSCSSSLEQFKPSLRFVRFHNKLNYVVLAFE